MTKLGDIEHRDDGYWLCTVEPFVHEEHYDDGCRIIQGGQLMKISCARAMYLTFINKVFGLPTLSKMERSWAEVMTRRSKHDDYQTRADCQWPPL